MSPTIDSGASAGAAAGSATATQVLRIVRGAATESEVAAIVSVLLAARRSSVEPSAAAASGWSDRSQFVRRSLPRGPAAWRQSTRLR